jgi:hypothetical protein
MIQINVENLPAQNQWGESGKEWGEPWMNSRFDLKGRSEKSEKVENWITQYLHITDVFHLIFRGHYLSDLEGRNIRFTNGKDSIHFSAPFVYELSPGFLLYNGGFFKQAVEFYPMHVASADKRCGESSLGVQPVF